MVKFLAQQILAVQPFKAIFILVAGLYFVLRIPLWIIYFALPALRQNPNWSLRQAVGVRIVRGFVYNVSLVRPRLAERFSPEGEKTQFVVMPPADPSTFVGITRSDVVIKPGKVGATWYPKPPAKGEKLSGFVTLHFHGGAYVIGDGRKADCGFLAKTLLKSSGTSYVLCPQYRLACNPGNKFPSQLQDAVSSYSYLVKTLGFDPKKIVVSGDSAGGNLTLALVKYLEEYGSTIGLDLPAAAVLWSPWPSPVRSSQEPEAIFDSPHYGTDYLTHMFGHWGAEALAPRNHTGLNLSNPYISFLGNPYKTSVPMCMTTGESEALYHDNIELFEEFNAIPGNKIEHQYIPNAVHDIILVGDKVGFMKEAERAAVNVGQFLRKVMTA